MAAWRGEAWRERLASGLDALRDRWLLADVAPTAGLVALVVLLLDLGLGWYWSREPDPFPVKPPANAGAAPGYTLATTTARVASILLDKPGGYIRNDMLPPGLFMDDMPAWELGVVQQLRDMTRALHHDMSVSRALYGEDRDLATAETQFNTDTDSWLFPSTESQYRRGTDALRTYAGRLGEGDGHAQFYPRPDTLNHWLSDVDVSLGRLSSRLNAALPENSVALPAETAASGLPVAHSTPWIQIDDVFYEARGSSWALIHLLKAVEIDFGPALRQHNAELSLRAAIHELEATQQTVWSPMILNGSGFGLFANHSLVMANYLSRAQADLKDVRELMQQ